jgi:hypothetical protein
VLFTLGQFFIMQATGPMMLERFAPGGDFADAARMLALSTVVEGPRS